MAVETAGLPAIDTHPFDKRIERGDELFSIAEHAWLTAFREIVFVHLWSPPREARKYIHGIVAPRLSTCLQDIRSKFFRSLGVITRPGRSLWTSTRCDCRAVGSLDTLPPKRRPEPIRELLRDDMDPEKNHRLTLLKLFTTS